ncbi:MAG: UTP--glucose-1-phosphate uridylyltransferase [Candidatus Cloacimonadota bacterium]|nr:MAG: UTP--glucose-1-phosphate uridylyltransferase [Candidatus Cloacimonadota bacterium]
MEKKIKKFTDIMRKENLQESVIDTFCAYYKKLSSGETGKIDRTMIDSPDEKDLLHYKNLKEENPALLQKLAIIKLNGGLGTGMGLNKAKSLLTVKDGLSFLDIIINQIISLRKKYNNNVPLIFMNSYNTGKDTLEKMNTYSDIFTQEFPFDFLQHKFPRIEKSELVPTEFENKNENWNPPGHGDIYLAMHNSGIIDKLINSGISYIFISNSDNLGAEADPKILTAFAENEYPFMMEVCTRTENDKKGGHLAKLKNGGFVLRETAQCPDEEVKEFQSTEIYKYFNTNNLWVNLHALKKNIEKTGRFDLSVIFNPKKVNGIEVIQLESAMGSAISVFRNSKAMLVPRSRFVPVKTSNELFLIRSDVFMLDEMYRLKKNPEALTIPTVELSNEYKFIDDFEKLAGKVPSLVKCKSLKVKGPIIFKNNVTVQGDVVADHKEYPVMQNCLLTSEKSSHN